MKWNRKIALDAVESAIAELDGEYDEEGDVFFDVKFEDDTLVVLVTDATNYLNQEEVKVTLS